MAKAGEIEVRMTDIPEFKLLATRYTDLKKAVEEARDKIHRNAEMRDMSVDWRTASVAARQYLDDVLAKIYERGEAMTHEEIAAREKAATP